MFWPNMNRQLEEFISKCETCNTFQPAQEKEPLICHEIPQRPWEKIGCDIFTPNNFEYLCTVDYYSDYFKIDELHKAKTGAAVIGKLKKCFASHGIPHTFHSDNGPPSIRTNFQLLLQCTSSNTSPVHPSIRRGTKKLKIQ